MNDVQPHSHDLVVDTHVHVFDPNRQAYAPERDYTPATATVANLAAHLNNVQAHRVVLVQPSVYGTDNTLLVEATHQLGIDRARAVAVIDDDTTDQELAALTAAGVRGLRLNVKSNPSGGTADIGPQLAELTPRAARHGLLVEIYASALSIDQASDVIAASPVPILLDHFGGIHTHGDGTVTGLLPVTELLTLGHVWVKLSAAYRVGPDTALRLPGVVAALLETRPDRLIWGSDWPHTGGGAERKARGPLAIEPFRAVNARHDLDELRSWIGDPDCEQLILTDNPDQLYGFSREHLTTTATPAR